MTEDGIRTRRNFPAETWAVIRDAYLGGETAESISRRLNLSINTIRKRATRCGWTHAAPVDLKQARDGAIAYAATLLGEGRALEASAVLRAAKALGRITGERGEGPPAEPAPPTAEAAAAKFEAQKEMMEAVHEAVRERADTLAFDLLTDRGPPQAAYGAFAFRWRAWVLGPEVALSDFRAGVHGGWASRYWDAEGRLLEVNPIPPRPDLLMVTQHLRRCQGVDWGQEDLTGWRWPPRDWWGWRKRGRGWWSARRRRSGGRGCGGCEGSGGASRRGGAVGQGYDLGAADQGVQGLGYTLHDLPAAAVGRGPWSFPIWPVR